MKIFEICYDSKGIFLPGTKLSGCLLIHFDEGLKFKAIRIRFIGQAQTEWNPMARNNQIDNAKHCNGRQFFFDEYLDLSIPVTANTLVAGERYEIPFSFELPKSIPPSFNHDIGQITYRCSAIIEQENFYKNLRKDKFFVVRPSFNLTHFPTCGRPYTENIILKPGLACINFGHIKAFVSLEKTGFVPGEWVKLVYNIANHCCGQKVLDLRMELQQLLHFRGKRDEKSSDKSDIVKRDSFHENIETIVNTCAKSYKSLDLSKEQATGDSLICLKIPEGGGTTFESATTILNCSIISVNYRILIEIICAGPFSINLETNPIMIPIYLGTVPVKGVIQC